MKLFPQFSGANVLITGGMGFIGSNLAIRLAESGAVVSIFDAMLPQYGGNEFNTAPVKDKVVFTLANITDASAVTAAVKGKDYVFHLAKQVNHVLSLTDPFPDIEYNVKGAAIVAEACRKHAPAAKVICTGTRGQYGKSAKLPVSEDAPQNPLGIYEITNLTAEKIFQVYNDHHGVRCVQTRLTNIYGPRGQMKTNTFGVANWFIRLAIDGQKIPVFGDGSLKRDFLYVDDCVDALLALALEEKAFGQVFNVGHDKPATILELVKKIVELAGSGTFEFTAFSEERRKQEPGDYYSDITKIGGLTGWRPQVALEEGLRRTIDYYRANKTHYW